MKKVALIGVLMLTCFGCSHVQKKDLPSVLEDFKTGYHIGYDAGYNAGYEKGVKVGSITAVESLDGIIGTDAAPLLAKEYGFKKVDGVWVSDPATPERKAE